MKKIPLVNPCLPQLDEIKDELQQMLQSGYMTNFGPFSRKLEKKISELIGVEYSLCLSNATTGLEILLNTLPTGSEVLVPSFTFLPTVQAILKNNLIPVFVDIDKDTYNISPVALAEKISNNTSAILAVNVFGNPCEIEELVDIAKDKTIKLFFDSAHAFGAKYNGSYLGGFGDAEVFSLSATKLLPCSEGGIITTNNYSFYKAILDRRNYGFTYDDIQKKYTRNCSNKGFNGKITEFSAILGLKAIESIDKRVQRRNEIALKYINQLSHLPGLSFQKIEKNRISTYKDFSIVVDYQSFGLDRNSLKERMTKEGIETDSYFSPAVHQMTYFQNPSQGKLYLKNTEFIEKRILSLPIYYDLSDEDIQYIINMIKDEHHSTIKHKTISFNQDFEHKRILRLNKPSGTATA